jgi:hypothetical protein
MKYMRLLAPSVIIPKQPDSKAFWWGSQHLGAGSVIGVMKNRVKSPITGDEREVYVKWVDLADRECFGWLAERTPMDRKIPAKKLVRVAVATDDRVTAWDQLRYAIGRDDGWDTKSWLMKFGISQVPLVHAVIRELGGRVPRSDDPIEAVRLALRLITHKEITMKQATEAVETATRKSSKKSTKKGAAKKGAVKQSKKQARSTEGGPGRVSAFAGKTIVRLVKENPRREDTHGYNSWNLLKKGMTYEQYIAAGGRRVDLAWDIMKGNVKLVK